MPDAPTPSAPTPVTPAPTGPAKKTQPRGYFNQAQVEDIGVAEDILAAASDPGNQTALADRDLSPEYLAGLGTFIAQARKKMAETGQSNDGQQAATLNAADAERLLVARLQGIQSAAKQRERMEQEDGDPETNFQATGYFIGQRLNPNRAALLQNAATLLGKADTDKLPGYRKPEALTAIADAIEDYKRATATQQERDEEAEQDRIERDALVRRINSRRMAIQHAADGLWPYTGDTHRPTRKRFKLPPDRPFNG